jgi:hypothetical protein
MREEGMLNDEHEIFDSMFGCPRLAKYNQQPTKKNIIKRRQKRVGEAQGKQGSPKLRVRQSNYHLD